MSMSPRSASPSLSYFQHAKHRRSSSLSDSFYICDAPKFYQNSPHSTTTFQTPPSSLSHQAFFVPLLPSQAISREQLGLNYSQCSLGDHSVKTRYPQPYSDNPFLPLRELRRLRSTELLARPPGTPDTPLNAFLPTPADEGTLTFSARHHKSPPSSDDGLDILGSTAQIHVTAATHFEDPVDLSINALVLGASAETSERSHPNRFSVGLPPTPLYDTYSTIDFPPISPPSASFQHIDTRRASASSDSVSVYSSLEHGQSFVDVNLAFSISEVSGCDEISRSERPTEEQDVGGDAYGGVRYVQFGPPVANPVEDEILFGKTLTNKPTSISWGGASTISRLSTRKRPPPIKVGNQAHGSPTVQIVAAGPSDLDLENPELKTSNSTVDISAPRNETEEVVSPRSVKLSDASAFSLSLFPPTPTTPIFRQSWIRSQRSPTTPRFPVGLAPPECSPNDQFAHAGSPPGLLPVSSAFKPAANSWPTPTPIRRSTIEVERRQAELTHMFGRPSALFGRSSVDTPGLRIASTTAVTTSPCQTTFTEPSMHSDSRHLQSISQVETETLAETGQCHRSRSDSCSSASKSVYSQDSAINSTLFHTDEGESMTMSVAAAVQREEENRHFEFHLELAYMHEPTDSSSGSGHQNSLDLCSSTSYSSAAEPASLSASEPEHQISERAVVSSNSIPSIHIRPPSRKPVPQTDLAVTISETVTSESHPSIHQPSTYQASSILASFSTLPSVSVRGSVKRKKGKIIISHPHLNDESRLGATVVSKRESIKTTLAIGPKVTHSASVGSLRDVLLSGGSPVHSPTHKAFKKQPHPPFDKYQKPSEDQLRLASNMCVLDENGQQVRFGDVFEGQKTAICFIRHFWCPLCQDYMSSIVHLTEPSFIQQAGVKLVIIGNGSPAMIKAYRDDIFHCPYEMYTDPSRQLYKVLGMSLKTTDGGDDADKGGYVKHGTFTGTMMVLKNALKMPLANAGDIKQLGGEFILGPGLTCSFTSRMHTTRSHTPIRDLLQAAGVEMNPWATNLAILQPGDERTRWMDAQNEDLDNMIRRGLRASCDKYCEAGSRDGGEIGQLDQGEFRQLLARLKSEVSESTSKKPRVVSGAMYEVEVMGQSRVRLDRLGAVEQSRAESVV